MFWILCVQRDVPCRLGQHLADNRTGEPGPPIIASNRPNFCQIGNATLWRLTETNLFENLINGILNGIHSSSI